MAKSSLPVAKAGNKEPVTINDSDKMYEERERKYRAKSALEDIERAEMHKRDRDLMKDVKKEAKAKVNSMKKAGLC